jgi:hypothetical protein
MASAMLRLDILQPTIPVWRLGDGKTDVALNAAA